MIKCELITINPERELTGDYRSSLKIKVNDYETQMKFDNKNDIKYLKDLIKTVADYRVVEIIESEVQE